MRIGELPVEKLIFLQISNVIRISQNFWKKRNYTNISWYPKKNHLQSQNKNQSSKHPQPTIWEPLPPMTYCDSYDYGNPGSGDRKRPPCGSRSSLYARHRGGPQGRRVINIGRVQWPISDTPAHAGVHLHAFANRIDSAVYCGLRVRYWVRPGY